MISYGERRTERESEGEKGVEYRRVFSCGCSPFSFDIGTGTNVVLACQDKLIIDYPFWFVV